MADDDDDKKRARIVGGEDMAPPDSGGSKALAILAGILVGLVIVAGTVWILQSGDDDTAASTTTSAPTTTAAETTTTAAPATTAAPTTTTAPTTTAAPTTTEARWDGGDIEPKRADGEPFDEYGLLADVRFAQREEGFTRVVFDFESADVVPWWTAEYQPGPFFSTDSSEVAVGGTHFLSIVFAGSGVDLSGAEFRITYEGPDRIDASTNSVVEIVRVEDFEGVSQWVIGVNGEKPFFVGELTDHARIYIDIAD